MPRITVNDNTRVHLRVRPEQKATLMWAATLRNMDLTDFVLQPALREAKKVIEEAERTTLSGRDSRMVLKLLEKPPAPNARLRKAFASLPQEKRLFRPGTRRRSRNTTAARRLTAAIPR